MANGSGNGNGGKWLAPPFLWQVIIGLLGATVGGLVGAFGMRDAVLTVLDQRIDEVEVRVEKRIEERLGTRVSRDEWWVWREDLNRQYNTLSNQLGRIEDRLKNSRRP